MEARLLHRHRQVVRQAGHRPDIGELADERADGQVEAERSRHRRRAGATGDHQDIGLERDRVSPLADLHPTPCRPTHELFGDAGGIGDAVLAADDRAEDIIDAKPRHVGRVHALDRHAERLLDRAPLLELRQPRLGRREEEVAHLLEERRAELAEERRRSPARA